MNKWECLSVMAIFGVPALGIAVGAGLEIYTKHKQDMACIERTGKVCEKTED
jgi:hypothetical protein